MIPWAIQREDRGGLRLATKSFLQVVYANVSGPLDPGWPAVL